MIQQWGDEEFMGARIIKAMVNLFELQGRPIVGSMDRL